MKKGLMLAASLALFASAASAESSFSFVGVDGDWISGGQSLSLTDQNATFQSSISTDGSHASFYIYNADHWWYVDFEAPNGEALATGFYDGATRYPFNDFDVPGFSASGDGRGCNTLSGSFNVRGIHVNAAGELDYFDAEFAQTCENVMPTLYGEISIDNRVQTEPLQLAVAIDPTGEAIRRGPTVVSGQVVCSEPTQVTLTGLLTQQRQRWRSAEGTFSKTFECNSSGVYWEAGVASDTNTDFSKGDAQLSVEATAVDPNYGGEVTAFADGTVTLTTVH